MGIGTIIFYLIVAFIGYKIIKAIVNAAKKSQAKTKAFQDRNKMLETRRPKVVESIDVEAKQGLVKNYEGKEVPSMSIIVRLPESDWEGVKYLVEEEHHFHFSCGNIGHVDNNFSLGWDELWGSIYDSTGSESKADAGVNRRVNLSEIWDLKTRGFLGTAEEKDCIVLKHHADEYSSPEEFKAAMIEEVKHLKALIENISVIESNKDLLKEGISEKIDI